MININSLDLNLLKVFHAIYKFRNVTKAANNIGLAQSSMSNALSRLRAQFNDPLFQRSAGGVIPTEKADELAPQIQEVLAHITLMIEPKSFDPVTANDHLVIAASDLAIATLAPILVPALRKKAPKIKLNFVPLDKTNVFEKLDDGSYDIAIGTFKELPARYNRKLLKKEKFVCIASSQHSKLNNKLSLKEFTEKHHVLMTLKADQVGVIDNELKKLGHTRTIAMTCAHFLPLVEVVANSDLIATVPEALAQIAIRAGCDIYPLPITMSNWDTELVVTQKFNTSNLGKFMIKLMLEQNYEIDSVE
ncbi:LysR family transcriptional regulator [Pseudoalteromonas phenolica]|uniref:Putative transcriptional regulatory protein, LysR-family n=1 Tax=Pseudoalteromonas phenolica TaxID=161398 RepID=A0A0S2K3U6_9GAMM|nr:LysR family transcriptional regulator [Pseudoalteromonas phenolica]ALO42739.1 Putative transcriptional regulatory protein, LysR-family [Pseudoalteromonas phenolica]MBE0356152.1 hypothetical protein [Pseudoalteromonas phenolica O-BC30]